MVSQFKRDEIAFELRHEDEAIRRANQNNRYRQSLPQTFTADQVWGCAAAAHRVSTALTSRWTKEITILGWWSRPLTKLWSKNG